MIYTYSIILSNLDRIGERICLIAVDGGWSEWGRFSGCSQTCKGGVKSRTRSCNNPAPVNGGSPCPGDYFETLECNTEINCKSNKAYMNTLQI